MSQTATHRNAPLVTGVLRRVDAALARGAAANAARAVGLEKARRRRWAVEEDALTQLPLPRRA